MVQILSEAQKIFVKRMAMILSLFMAVYIHMAFFPSLISDKSEMRNDILRIFGLQEIKCNYQCAESCTNEEFKKACLTDCGCDYNSILFPAYSSSWIFFCLIIPFIVIFIAVMYYTQVDKIMSMFYQMQKLFGRLWSIDKYQRLLDDDYYT